MLFNTTQRRYWICVEIQPILHNNKSEQFMHWYILTTQFYWVSYDTTNQVNIFIHWYRIVNQRHFLNNSGHNIYKVIWEGYLKIPKRLVATGYVLIYNLQTPTSAVAVILYIYLNSTCIHKNHTKYSDMISGYDYFKRNYRKDNDTTVN